MTTPLSVDLDQLTSHSESVADFGGRTGSAADDANQLSSMNEAYGVFCQVFGAMLVEPQQQGAASIRATAEAMKDVSVKLREAAVAYKEADERLAKALGEILESLGPAGGPGRGGGR